MTFNLQSISRNLRGSGNSSRSKVHKVGLW